MSNFVKFSIKIKDFYVKSFTFFASRLAQIYTHKYLNAIHIDAYMYKKFQKIYMSNVALQQIVVYTTHIWLLYKSQNCLITQLT